MNTPPEAPAWYLPVDRAARRAARERLSRRLLPPAQAGDRGARRRRTSSRSRSAPAVTRSSCSSPRSGSGPDASRWCIARPTSSTRSRPATSEPRSSAIEPRSGHRARLGRVPRSRAAGARRVHLLAEQPDGTRGERRARARGLRRLPRHRVLRPGLPRARRRRPPAAGGRARQPDHRAHVLEGLRARRRARRLRDRTARADRRARLAAPARLALVVVGRGRRDRLCAGGRDARARRAHGRRARPPRSGPARAVA